MSATIIERSYRDPITGDWLPFLRENAMGKVEAFVRYQNEYSIGFDSSFTFESNGLQINLQYGNWQDEGNIGLVAGSVITFYWSDGATNYAEARTITDVNGGSIFINTPLPSIYAYNTFPSGTIGGTPSIRIDKTPASVEFDFNLAQQSNPNASSVLDGNVTRFKLDGVDLLSVGSVVPMVQSGQFHSGGHVKDVTLEIQSETDGASNITRTIKISYTFYQWGVLQSGYDEPNYYPLAPYQDVRNYIQNGNLDGLQRATSPATTGNLAAYGENFYNGGNPYTFTSIQWFDLLGNQIDAPDYSNNCTFLAIVDAPFQSTTLSKYKLSSTLRPIDDTRYQNKAARIGEVLRWNVSDTIYNHSATPNPAIITGLTDSVNRFDFTDIKFFVNGGNLEVSGKLQPINMVDYFEGVNGVGGIAIGDRKMTISISLSNHSLDADSTDRVELKIWDGDLIDAPTLGVQYPYVQNEYLVDHAGNNIIDNSTPNTTTSDDILYKSHFLLEKNVVYDGVRAEIFVQNDITGERFTLESNLFDFSDIQYGAYQNGIHEWNRTIDRNFLLPISSERNIISVKRATYFDTTTMYGMEIRYGFLSRIESWIANGNVNDYFFNAALLNNGKNQNWQRFTDGDWQLKVAYYPIKNDTSDFQIYSPKTRPFNDDTNFQFSTVLTQSNGTVVNGIAVDPQNPLLNLKVTVIYTVPLLDTWFTLQLRNKEGAAIGFISTVLDRDNINVPNALKQLSTETKLKKTIASNTAILECNINTSLVNVNEVTLIPRAHTLTDDKDHLIDTSGFYFKTTWGDYLITTV
tara:strand:- start:148 stop:2553 length:2406 start_codon:yes stop_codon:yes gene_type:complete